MKIGFICSEYPPAKYGGIGVFTRTLARELVVAGHEVRVLGIASPGDTAPAYEEDQGVQVWRQKARSPKGFPLGWVHARYELFQTIKNWSEQGLIDLVEAPDFQGICAGWGRLQIPVVVRMHGTSTYFAHEAGSKVRWSTFVLERSALRRADFLASCSRYTAQETKRLFSLGSEIRVIHNGTRVPSVRTAEPRSANEVVYTGTLTGKKGIISLVRAWPTVHAQRAEAVLKIFGKDGRSESGGSMQDYLRSLLPPECRASVRFYGHVAADEIHTALKSARMAVFPSYSEAFALAPLEAMATGCPTVFTQRSSGPELIQDGETGVLIDPDQPEELATAIVRLLGDDELAHRLGAAGHQRVLQHFSLGRLRTQTAEFYGECVNEFAKRGPSGQPRSSRMLKTTEASE